MIYYYIGHYLEDLKDGGQSRNKAFQQYINNKHPGVRNLNVYNKNILIRFLMFIRTLLLFYFSNGNKIFVHQGSLLVLFPLRILSHTYIRKGIFWLLQKAVKRNRVIIEVNDLPFEQLSDLGLPSQDLYYLFEENLYSLKDCYYIFASHLMAQYASKHFNIPIQNIEAIINGGYKISNSSNNVNIPCCLSGSGYKYVYAGSLNIGRQIERLIDLFQNRSELLILIGEWGEWIKKISLSENIHYLGKFTEEHAHVLVSKCDMGLIPYDETKFYYNICYPTKASFYITAGIPFLSTPLSELVYVFKGYKRISNFLPFAQWALFMDSQNKFTLREARADAIENNESFLWETLFADSLNL